MGCYELNQAMERLDGSDGLLCRNAHGMHQRFRHM